MGQQEGREKKYRIVQVRLKRGDEDDLIAWVDEQLNASEAIRLSMRLAMAFAGGDEDRLRAIVTEATTRRATFSGDEARLRTIVAEAVREVLADVVITAQQPDRSGNGCGDEDPVLAARLDGLFD
jgi:hypothetical protein